MCVIITKAKGFTEKDRDELLQAAVTNPDGYGIFFGGKVYRTTNPKLAIDKAIKEKATVFHARISTGSKVTASQCHPFDCGDDRYLFHNGIVGHSTAEQSDTQRLANFLKPFNTEEAKTILKFLHNKGKGKFVLTSGDKIEFEIGLTEGRSNTNHLYTPAPTYNSYGGYKRAYPNDAF